MVFSYCLVSESFAQNSVYRGEMEPPSCRGVGGVGVGGVGVGGVGVGGVGDD